MRKSVQQHRLAVVTAYQSLEPRDRFAVLLLSVFTAILILLYGLVMPAIHYHAEARTAYQHEKELLYWLQSLAPTVKQLNNPVNGAAPGQGNTLSSVNSSAKQFDLSIKRIQPGNNGDLQVWMEGVNFNNSLKWLHHLHQAGLSTRDITLEKTAAGEVNLRATFGS